VSAQQEPQQLHAAACIWHLTCRCLMVSMMLARGFFLLGLIQAIAV
jgi:hypothetical protein